MPSHITGKQHPERAEQFRQLIARWKESGLNQSEFCRIEKLNLSTFSSWKRAFENGQIRSSNGITPSAPSKKGLAAKKQRMIARRSRGNARFIPVEIVGNDQESAKTPTPPPRDERRSTQIHPVVAAELVGNAGLTLKIFDGASASTIEAIVAAWCRD